MSRSTRTLIFSLAVILVAALIHLTHEASKLSSWIVYADHVWGEMDRTGHSQEHYFAEGLHQLRSIGVVWLEIAVSIVFLTLLGRHLWVHSGPAIDQPGWRVGHSGRDDMFYEEFINGRWERLRVSGEMLMGRAHHIIYFASIDEWADYPAWAQGRRSEIIARIQSRFHPPDYEYHKP